MFEFGCDAIFLSHPIMWLLNWTITLIFTLIWSFFTNQIGIWLSMQENVLKYVCKTIWDALETWLLFIENIVKQMCYSSANKNFAVLRRNRSDPLSRAMGCIGELRAGSRSARYERFGTGNLAPLAVLVPIPKPATHSKGVSNQHPHCTVYIWMYQPLNRCEICTGTSKFSNFIIIIFSPCDWSDALKRRISYMLSIYKQTAIYIYIFPWYKQPLASLHFYFNWWNKNQNITFILIHNLLCAL